MPFQEKNSFLPRNIIRESSLWVLMRMGENFGQNTCTLWRASVEQINMFISSTRITDLDSPCSRTVFMACINASAPPWTLVAVCRRGLANSTTSELLFDGIIPQVTYTSNEFQSRILDDSFLAEVAILSLRYLFSFLHFVLVRTYQNELRPCVKGHKLPLLNKLLWISFLCLE